MADRIDGFEPEDKAALEELERFRREIEVYRARRRAVGEEFDQFVRSMKTSRRGGNEGDPSGSLALFATESAPRTAGSAGSDRLPPSLPRLSADPRSQPGAAPFLPDPVRSVEPIHTRRRVLLATTTTLALIAALALWTDRLSAPSATESAAGATAPEAEPAPVPPPTPPPPVSANPAPEFTNGLTTTRRVWVRVLVDGERVLERELPAGARVPLRVGQTFVIRTGDAGALRVTLAGQDQGPLGREGQVVTRTFSVPSDADRQP